MQLACQTLQSGFSANASEPALSEWVSAYRVGLRLVFQGCFRARCLRQDASHHIRVVFQ